METHNLFIEKGISNVSSFGTGSQIKLPGPSRNQPNVYDFGVSYREIYEDLMSKDAQLYADKLEPNFHSPELDAMTTHIGLTIEFCATSLFTTVMKAEGSYKWCRGT